MSVDLDVGQAPDLDSIAKRVVQLNVPMRTRSDVFNLIAAVRERDATIATLREALEAALEGLLFVSEKLHAEFSSGDYDETDAAGSETIAIVRKALGR